MGSDLKDDHMTDLVEFLTKIVSAGQKQGRAKAKPG